MGTSSCCGNSSRAEEMKIENIPSIASKRLNKEKTEDGYIPNAYISASPLLDSKSQVEIGNNSSEDKVQQEENVSEGIYEYEVIQRINLMRTLVKKKNSEARFLNIVKKSEVRDLKKYANYLEELSSHDSEILYNPLELYEDDINYYIVSKIPAGLRLFEIYSKSQKFFEEEVQKYMVQLISAIITTEENLLFLNPYEIYITSEDVYTVKLVTFSYTPDLFKAPEQIQSFSNEKTIVWNLGVLLYVMLSGKSPFKGDLEVSIVKGLFSFSGKSWNNVSYAAKALIMKMLTINPQKRPSITEVFQDSWISNKICSKNPLGIQKRFNEFLKLCKISECKNEILIFCNEFSEKIKKLKAKNSKNDENDSDKSKEIDFFFRDKIEFIGNHLESYKSQQKILLHTILSNLLLEADCNSILSPNLANFLLSEIEILEESDLIENEISVMDFSDLILSLLSV